MRPRTSCRPVPRRPLWPLPTPRRCPPRPRNGCAPPPGASDAGCVGSSKCGDVSGGNGRNAERGLRPGRGRRRCAGGNFGTDVVHRPAFRPGAVAKHSFQDGNPDARNGHHAARKGPARAVSASGGAPAAERIDRPADRVERPGEAFVRTRASMRIDGRHTADGAPVTDAPPLPNRTAPRIRPGFRVRPADVTLSARSGICPNGPASAPGRAFVRMAARRRAARHLSEWAGPGAPPGICPNARASRRREAFVRTGRHRPAKGICPNAPRRRPPRPEPGARP